MKPIKVLVAEGDQDLLHKLTSEIEKAPDLNLVGSTSNGKDVLALIEKSHPNIILFDMFLPYYDGFSLIEKIRENDLFESDSKYIMTSMMTNNQLVSETFRRGIDYLLIKPYDLDSLSDKLKRIYTIMNTKTYITGNPQSLQISISNFLDGLGIPASLTGYKYIATAIEKTMDDEEMLEGVTKILYPEIAKTHNSTPPRVEKAIRHAIEVAWNKNPNGIEKEPFKLIIKDGKKRPTNSEFIATICRQLKLST